jgi:hypothetical protein
MNNNTMIKYINQMIILFNKKMNYLYKYDTNSKLNINHNFPEDKLVEIMRPYILIYLKYINSYTKSIRDEYYIELKNKLCNFYLYNPQFGRKIIKIVNKKLVILFNDKHISYKDNIFLTHCNNTLYENSNNISNHNVFPTIDDDDTDDDTIDENSAHTVVISNQNTSEYGFTNRHRNYENRNDEESEEDDDEENEDDDEENEDDDEENEDDEETEQDDDDEDEHIFLSQ